MPIVIDNSPNQSTNALAALAGERRMFDDRLGNTLAVGQFDLNRRRTDQSIASSRLRDDLALMDRQMRMEELEAAQAQRQQSFDLLRQRLETDVAQGFYPPEASQFVLDKVAATGDIKAGFDFANQARTQARQQEADQVAAQSIAEAVRMAAEPYIQYGSLTADQADNVAAMVAAGQMDGNQALLRMKEMSVGLDKIKEAQEAARTAEMAREAGARALRVIAARLPEEVRDEAAEIIVAFEDGGLSAPQAMAALQSLAPPSQEQAAQVQIAKERLRAMDKQLQDLHTAYRETENQQEKRRIGKQAIALRQQMDALEDQLGMGQQPAAPQPAPAAQPAAPDQQGVVQEQGGGGSMREALPPEVAESAQTAVQQAISELGPGAKPDAIKKRAREILAEQAQKQSGQSQTEQRPGGMPGGMVPIPARPVNPDPAVVSMIEGMSGPAPRGSAVITGEVTPEMTAIARRQQAEMEDQARRELGSGASAEAIRRRVHEIKLQRGMAPMGAGR